MISVVSRITGSLLPWSFSREVSQLSTDLVSFHPNGPSPHSRATLSTQICADDEDDGRGIIASEPLQVGNQVITQKSLYTALFVIGTTTIPTPAVHLGRAADDLQGIPLLWFASPVSTFFWLVGSSSILILGHACLIEPGVESEYGGVEGA